jgi:uncharacterized membrane protein YdfJ with MMPL/SSD domain
MSNTHVGAHPIIPRMIRLFSVPILLFWLTLTVIVNVVARTLVLVAATGPFASRQAQPSVRRPGDGTLPTYPNTGAS